MEKLIFLFYTPESAGETIKSYLQDKDTIILDDVNSQLWDLFNLSKKFKTQSFERFGNLLLEDYFLEDSKKRVVICDHKMGINYGFGFRMWVFLMRNFDAKIIFCHGNLDNNLAQILGNKDKWIPSYGSCITNCENNLKNQIQQMDQFAAFYSEASIVYLSPPTKEEVLKFIYG